MITPSIGLTGGRELAIDAGHLRLAGDVAVTDPDAAPDGATITR